MRLIILAAGKGQRIFSKIKKNKCLIEIKGISLIKKIIKDFKESGFKNITVITGFNRNRIQKHLQNDKISILHNSSYVNKEMLYSFILALKKYKNENIFLSYSDIRYNKKIFYDSKNFLTSKKIILPINKKWAHVWKKRKKNIKDDCETLVYNKNKNLIEIGNKITSLKKVNGQFMGLVYITKNRIINILKYYESINSALKNKMHLSSFINFMLKKNEKIKCHLSYSDWYEFDDINDYKNFFK